MLFSTETGDAWLLDRTDLLAARLARDGESATTQIVETAATFAIEWTGSYRINGPAFVYSDRDTGRVITILGYPIDKLVGTKLRRNAQHRSGGKFQICLASCAAETE